MAVIDRDATHLMVIVMQRTLYIRHGPWQWTVIMMQPTYMGGVWGRDYAYFTPAHARRVTMHIRYLPRVNKRGQ